MKTLVSLAALMAFALTGVYARNPDEQKHSDQKHADKHSDQKNAGEKQHAETAEKNAGFERLKSLVGEWSVKGDAKDKEHHGGAVTYKLTSGGNAVLETLFVGSDHEMISIYHLEGKKLAMTHFCVLPNQPHMTAKAGDDHKKLVFTCQGGKHLDCEKDNHMHQATITFVDDDHIKSEWTMFEKGKAAGTHSFELERKKK